ncbi:hypothetical protein CP971_09080 [Streptomyces viridifaciens]|nr:hypothetical protein CP971_09080 [Streptomyces viridifaciens]
MLVLGREVVEGGLHQVRGGLGHHERGERDLVERFGCGSLVGGRKRAAARVVARHACRHAQIAHQAGGDLLDPVAQLAVSPGRQYELVCRHSVVRQQRPPAHPSYRE